MNTRNTTIALPTERAVQVRNLSDHLGMSMSETMQALFKLARDQGLMTNHDLPGVRVNALADGIVVQFDNGQPAPFSFTGARALVETIRQFATGESKAPHLINLDHEFSVRRKGRGIIVEISFSNNASSKAWNADIASDFADLIEDTIKKHEPK